MKRFFPLLAAVAAFTTTAWSVPSRPTSAAPVAPQVRHVFIVSFDGGKPSVMQQSAMPLTLQMARQGAHTWTARTISPSITLPSHTSMLTGVGPNKHKVLWNDYQPDKGVVTVSTIFSLAKARGLKTALFAGKEKFKHLNLPRSLDRFAVPAYSAKTVARTAADFIVAHKPNLCFIHFADSDGAGHEFGWGSSQQKQSFAVEDGALKTIRAAITRAGIASSSVIILSADHGGHDRTHGSDDDADKQIPWIAWGARVRPRFAITAPVATFDTAATALWLLKVPIPASFDGKPVKSAFLDAR